MRPHARLNLTPTLLSPPKHINSDWVRACHTGRRIEPPISLETPTPNDRKGIKNGGRQKQIKNVIWTLLLSSVTGVTNYLSAELSQKPARNNAK